MPASKAEQVLDALKALLETVPDAVVERNSVLPEKIGGGLIILRDGDPGNPEQALGGFGSTYYQHAVEGPDGVQASFDFRRAKNDAAGRMLTVTLTNDLDGNGLRMMHNVLLRLTPGSVDVRP